MEGYYSKALTGDIEACIYLNSLNLSFCQEYIGTFDRFHVTRHWLLDYVYARYIKFRPTEVFGGHSVCMRIQVLGCLGMITIPISILTERIDF